MNENCVGLLDEYGVQLVVLDFHNDSEMLNLLRSQPEWAIDSEDGEVVIFIRADIARTHDDAPGGA